MNLLATLKDKAEDMFGTAHKPDTLSYYAQDAIEIFNKLRNAAQDRNSEGRKTDIEHDLVGSIARLDVLITVLQNDDFDIDDLRTIEDCTDFIPSGFPGGMQGIQAAKDIAAKLSKYAGLELETVHGAISVNTRQYAQKIFEGHGNIETYGIIGQLNDELEGEPDFGLAIAFIDKLSKAECPLKQEIDFTANIWEYTESKGFDEKYDLKKGDFVLIQQMASALSERLPAKVVAESSDTDVEQNDISL